MSTMTTRQQLLEELLADARRIKHPLLDVTIAKIDEFDARYSDDLPLESEIILARTNKIAAIKEYRARTGCGLKKSLDVINAALRTGRGRTNDHESLDTLHKRIWNDIRALQDALDLRVQNFGIYEDPVQHWVRGCLLAAESWHSSALAHADHGGADRDYDARRDYRNARSAIDAGMAVLKDVYLRPARTDGES